MKLQKNNEKQVLFMLTKKLPRVIIFITSRKSFIKMATLVEDVRKQLVKVEITLQSTTWSSKYPWNKRNFFQRFSKNSSNALFLRISSN